MEPLYFWSEKQSNRSLQKNSLVAYNPIVFSLFRARTSKLDFFSFRLNNALDYQPYYGTPSSLKVI